MQMGPFTTMKRRSSGGASMRTMMASASGVKECSVPQPSTTPRTPRPADPAEWPPFETHYSQMFDALEWIAGENDRPGSPFHGKVVIDKVAVMGHSCGGLQAVKASVDPRITTALVLNSGMLADGDQYIAVHRAAHALGMKTNCTMLYGHIETFEHRVDHLLRLRALQAETGGVQCFIPLAFHNENNGLERLPEPPPVPLDLIAVIDRLTHIAALSPLQTMVAYRMLWGDSGGSRRPTGSARSPAPTSPTRTTSSPRSSTRPTPRASATTTLSCSR